MYFNPLTLMVLEVGGLRPVVRLLLHLAVPPLIHYRFCTPEYTCTLFTFFCHGASTRWKHTTPSSTANLIEEYVCHMSAKCIYHPPGDHHITLHHLSTFFEDFTRESSTHRIAQHRTAQHSKAGKGITPKLTPHRQRSRGEAT